MDRLYVRLTNLPGPGTAALLDEQLGLLQATDSYRAAEPALRELLDETYRCAKLAALRASEFVELENAEGHGQGDDTGADWIGDGQSVRLGPFAPIAALERLEAVEAWEKTYAEDLITESEALIEAGDPFGVRLAVMIDGLRSALGLPLGL